MKKKLLELRIKELERFTQQQADMIAILQRQLNSIKKPLTQPYPITTDRTWFNSVPLQYHCNHEWVEYRNTTLPHRQCNKCSKYETIIDDWSDFTHTSDPIYFNKDIGTYVYL